ncbi:MAG: right-handed parallel beta-helix repeat-containing protein [bacterium]|nr:right-handed parallel beta-helix repeat-containing protein [bacterium]
MRAFRTAVFFIALILVSLATAQPMEGRWTIAMSPITIAASCTVQIGDTLVVDPGVTINITRSNANFVIRGMAIIGVPDQAPVRINGAGSPGLSYENTNQLNRITAQISGMNRGLRVRGSILSVVQTDIQSPSSFGIDASRSTVNINRSLISTAGQSGIKLDSGSTMTFTESSIRFCINHGIYAMRGAGITLQNSTILNNNNHGIWIDGTINNGRLYVFDSDISQNGQRGVYINNVSNNLLERVSIVANGNDGLYLLNASGMTATRLTLSDNGNRAPGGSGLFLFNSTVSYVTSSAIDNNENYGVYAQSSTVNLRYCNFFANQGGNVQGTTVGSNAITVNPQWQQSTGHQRIPIFNSPLVDAGEWFLPRDPDGSPPDIGHRYYNQNLPPVFQTWTPVDTALTRNYGSPTLFRVTYSDPNANDSVRVSWYVNNTLSGTGDSILLPFYVPAVVVRVELNDTKPNGIATKSWAVSVGATEIQNLPEQFAIHASYPNPTNGSIHLTGVGVFTGEIRLTDLLGRTVAEKSFRTLPGKWTITWQFPSTLPSGSYYLQVPNQKPISLILLK